jgi:hypothetical protein
VDLIPAKMLGPGRYTYVVAVDSGGTSLARAERSLVVLEPAAAKP